MLKRRDIPIFKDPSNRAELLSQSAPKSERQLAVNNTVRVLKSAEKSSISHETLHEIEHF
jgi:hypothetical protein